MITIQKYEDVEPEFFLGRNFNDSNEVVDTVLNEVQKKGDAALRVYGQKFDVSVPASFEVPQEELKAAAEKLKIEKRDVYDAIIYSHELTSDCAHILTSSNLWFRSFEYTFFLCSYCGNTEPTDAKEFKLQPSSVRTFRSLP